MSRVSGVVDDAARSAAVVFKDKGWNWSSSDQGELYVPDALDIRDTLLRLRKSLDNPKTLYSSSGRLRVMRLEHEGEPDSIGYFLELGEEE